MKHLGDITKINGAEIEPVDVITGGSPCQDLSVAGKREGLAGERSGLFMEQIRIIKEMREADVLRGRTGQLIRPRFMVWENVPGAFSSNGGKDFAVVLEETIRIAEPSAPALSVPAGGWPRSGCLYDEMGRWSVAWRVHNAEFWGVPQRRRRISLVADFGGLGAPEVLFVRKGLSRDSEEGGEAREEAAAGAGGGAYPTVAIRMREGCAGGGKGPLVQVERSGTLGCGNDQVIICGGFKAGNGAKASGIGYKEETAPTLSASESGTNQVPAIICLATRQGGAEIRSDDKAPTLTAAAGMSGNNQPVICLQGNGIDRADTARCNGKGWKEDVSFTLNTIDRHAVYDARGNGDGKTACTLTGDHQSRITDYTNIVMPVDTTQITCPTNMSNPCYGDPCFTLSRDSKPPCIVSRVSKTLRGSGSNPFRADMATYPVIDGFVRRLTPLECERLQGYPDGWANIGEWTDSKGKKHKEADSPRYKALGNSIALPFWFWLLRRIASLYERPATLGSLFDGIGGFPLCWERCNGPGTARWASEIEEFPMAVVRKRFGDEEVGDIGDAMAFLWR